MPRDTDRTPDCQPASPEDMEARALARLGYSPLIYLARGAADPVTRQAAQQLLDAQQRVLPRQGCAA